VRGLSLVLGLGLGLGVGLGLRLVLGLLANAGQATTITAMLPDNHVSLSQLSLHGFHLHFVLLSSPLSFSAFLEVFLGPVENVFSFTRRTHIFFRVRRVFVCSLRIIKEPSALSLAAPSSAGSSSPISSTI